MNQTNKTILVAILTFAGSIMVHAKSENENIPHLYSKINGYCELTCQAVGFIECQQSAYLTFEDCILEQNPIPGYIPY